MQKLILITTILMLISTTSQAYALIEDATAPAEPNVNEVTENIRERLAETISGDEDNSIRLYGYVGTVRDVIKNTIVIEDKDGKKNISITDESLITRSPGNAKIKVDSISVGDNIIAIGNLQDQEVESKKVIVSSDSFAPPQKLSGLGKIDKISKSSISITSTSGTVTLDINSKTIFKTSDGLLDFSDLQVGDHIVYAGTKIKDDQTASILFRIKSSN